MRKVLEEQGPFDGVWGFSQGAAMAAMVASLVERPSLHPVFAAPGKDWPPAPFKFAIIGSGFLPMDPRCAPWFSPKVETPSLHILGRADTIVGEGESGLDLDLGSEEKLIMGFRSADRSMALVNAFVDPRVERHDGGALVWCCFAVPITDYFLHRTSHALQGIMAALFQGVPRDGRSWRDCFASRIAAGRRSEAIVIFG